MTQRLDRQYLRKFWEEALIEDGAQNDLTSLVATREMQIVRARVSAREAGTFAGAAVFDVLGESLPGQITLTLHVADGDRIKSGTDLATIAGPLRLLLAMERTLLNFLQRLCGVATLTRRYVDAVAGTTAEIYDTRKTIPGWRQLDKYAVRCGGGHNHRMGLHDAILVKDNHLAGIEPRRLSEVAAEIVRGAATLNPPPDFIEFEVDTLDQFDALVEVSGVDVILLDNFTPAQMRKAVACRDERGLTGRLELEASGGINLDKVKEIAAAGVDRIAVGAITHSAPALDIALDIEPA